MPLNSLRSMHKWIVCFCAIVLVEIAILPAQSQFGDSFSSGSAGTVSPSVYYVEWTVCESDVHWCALTNSKDVCGQPRTGASAVSHHCADDVFAESANQFGARFDCDAFTELSSHGCFSQQAITGSQTTTVVPGQSPMLEGATNGTIGPQSEDATVVQGVITTNITKQLDAVDTYNGPCNIIFVNPNPCLGKVRLALRDLDAPRTSCIQVVPPVPLITGKPTVAKILKAACDLEAIETMRIRKYRVFANLRLKAHHQRQRCLWAEVYYEQPAKMVLSALYTQAARLEADPVRRNIYLGTASCYRQDWNDAWRHFEQVYKLDKDDHAVMRDVVDQYRKMGGRDLELCIWLTRFLRVAADWTSFDIAFNERHAIEQRYADEKFAHERGPNVVWDSHSMPLKVYFPGSKAADYDRRLMDYFRRSEPEWSRATGVKVDFVEISDAKKADIICQWQEPANPYKQYEGSAALPQGTPELSDAGMTWVWTESSGRSNPRATRALIEVYARQGGSMRTMDDDMLWIVCLHEVGHALGIMKHLHGCKDIMYAYVYDCLPGEDSRDELSNNDKSTICSLYKELPVNQSAVDKFLGMRAICKKLNFSAGQLFMLQADDAIGSGELPFQGELNKLSAMMRQAEKRFLLPGNSILLRSDKWCRLAGESKRNSAFAEEINLAEANLPLVTAALACQHFAADKN